MNSRRHDRRERRERMQREPMHFNATPMVDVIFMLTIFFMLVSRFSSAEQVPMELPDPQGSQAEAASLPNRVVINCRLARLDDAAGRDVLYSIGPNRAVPLAGIADQLASMRRVVPNLEVVLRADRRLHYADVREVMRVVAAQGIEMINVVAHVGEDE